MSHFSPKSLIFYGTAISSVVTLFAIVTAYGEKNLRTSPPITGGYSFQLPPSADCAAQEKVNLFIQQSGIYISAALLNAKDPPPKDKTLSGRSMTLHGQSKNQQFMLEGDVPRKSLCSTSDNSTKSSVVKTKIQGSLNHSTLSGKLLVNSMDSIPFTAERLLQQKTQESSH